MPVTVSTEYLYTDSSGKKWVFTQEEAAAIKPETTITLTCSGPKCQARHALPEPFSLTWVQEELAKDPLNMSDSFFKVLKLGINTSPATELVFCSAACLRDYLTYVYVPPLSPREQQLRAKQEQEEQLSNLNPHLKSPADGATCTENVLPSADDLDAVAREQEIAAITQGDGYAGDPGDEHQ